MTCCTNAEQTAGGTPGIWLGRLLFLLWGAAAFYLLASGSYTTFLNPSLWPLVLAALLLSGAFLTALFVIPHGHAVRTDIAWARTGVLALPLLFVICGFGQTLGSDALEKRFVGGIANLGTLGDVDDDFDTHFQKPGNLDILQLVRRGKALEGAEVTTVGQVARGVGEPSGHYVLFRFVVTCCVADARPVGILVDGNGRKPPPKDQWYKVKGVLEATEIEGKTAHVIRASDMLRIPKPKEPYLYGF